MHRNRLPPLTGLLALDAFARHGTVQLAAEELGLSQSAASRRLIGLESDLGLPLFDRRTRPISLTREGRELHKALRAGLAQIEQTIARLTHAPRESFTISAGAGFSTYWLIPRLARMQRAFPEFILRIVSQSHDRDTDASGDLQIRFGEPPWTDCEATPLFSERVFPVASPLLLKGKLPPRSTEELRRLPLLDMEVRRQPWFDWSSWLTAVGGAPPRRGELTYFDSYPLAVSAALAGQGVCLSWNGLLEGFLQSGALVRLTPHEAISPRGYAITHATGLEPSHPVRRMAQWILDEAAMDAGQTVLTDRCNEPTRQMNTPQLPTTGKRPVRANRGGKKSI